MTLNALLLDSPVGGLLCMTNERGALVALPFVDDEEDVARMSQRYGRGDIVRFGETSTIERVATELDEYFRGERRRFTLSVDPHGTPFQRAVWAGLAAIPYGETLGYAELAGRIGRPGAARAVGRANATNPIPIVLPCHRVIGANGDLTGYGGGMDRKRFLLRLEGALEAQLSLEAPLVG